tara:strand:- start:59 stop:532 length:474 start_codon:yes stop_codon:yes gene_type:complete
MKIIKNFLKEEEFNLIKNIVMGDSFPYFFCSLVATKKDNNNFYFVHTFYNKNVPTSNYFNLIRPLINKLNILSLIRAKVNCFPRSKKLIKYGKHFDNPFKHKGAVYYINTCDGGTYLGDKFIPSVANTILLFDSSEYHQSTNCTDQKCRFNININYF